MATEAEDRFVDIQDKVREIVNKVGLSVACAGPRE